MLKTRLSDKAPLYIGGVGRIRVTGGLVDLSMVDDLPRHRAKYSRAGREAAAATAERDRYSQLCHAWEHAAKGADKRAALAELRAFERATGRMPYKPMIRDERHTVDVSLGAESWLERK